MQIETDLENDRDEDFDAGYSSELKPDSKPVADSTVTPPAETTPPAAEVETGTPAEAPAVIEAPKFIQITQEQWDAVQAAAARTEGMEKRIRDTVQGTVGDLEQRIVKKLQAATPVGQSIELPVDVVSELEADFPELAPRIRKTLEKALKGLRGTGTQAETPDADRWQSMVKAASIQYQKEELEEQYPNWREIVGAVDGLDKHDPKNPYRQWLAQQPAEYQLRINNTNSAQVIGKSIDRFKAATEKKPATPATPPGPAPKTVARQNVIRGAVQPKGDGGQPAPSNTAEDEFESGFSTG